MIYFWLLAVDAGYDWSSFRELPSSDSGEGGVLTPATGTILFLLGGRMFGHGEKNYKLVFFDPRLWDE